MPRHHRAPRFRPNWKSSVVAAGVFDQVGGLVIEEDRALNKKFGIVRGDADEAGRYSVEVIARREYSMMKPEEYRPPLLFKSLNFGFVPDDVPIEFMNRVLQKKSSYCINNP